MKRQPSEQSNLIVAHLRSGGLTFKDVADLFGISRERVGRIAKRAGITGRDNGGWQISGARRRAAAGDQRRAALEERQQRQQQRRRAVEDAVVEMRQRGMLQVEIAIALGIQQPAVSTILIRRGHRTQRSHATPSEQENAQNAS